MPIRSDRKKELDKILDTRTKKTPRDQRAKDMPTINIHTGNGIIAGNGSVIIDRRKTVIINKCRRVANKITEQQQLVIKAKIDELVKLDRVTISALNPDDTRQDAAIRNSSRCKRWNALRKKFSVRSYKNLTQAQFLEVCDWLEGLKMKMSAKNVPNCTCQKPPPEKGTSSTTLLGIILVISLSLAGWPFVRTLLPDPPPAKVLIYYSAPVDPVVT